MRSASPLPRLGTSTPAGRPPLPTEAGGKRMALVGYVSDVFFPFTDRLEAEGFQIFWIHSLRSWSATLRKHGVEQSRILDVSDRARFPADADEATRQLAGLEAEGLPNIRDIVLMDRILRHHEWSFALRYLAYVQRRVTAFLLENRVACVSSGRDTALQLLVMLVCKRLAIPWGCVTRTKLPKDRFGLTHLHIPQDFIPLRRVKSGHVEQARAFLAEFRNQDIAPLVRKAPAHFADVLRLLPRHAGVLGRGIRNSLIADRGNTFARYPVRGLISRFVRNKANLVFVRYRLPLAQGSERPYVFFGLHRQPESSIDVTGSFFSDQIATIRQVARAIPAGHDLLVKIHTADIDGQRPAFYKTLRAIPGVVLVDPHADARRLIRNAGLVVTIAGSPGYEAALLGKPVICLSPVFWNRLPTVRFCQRPPELPGLVRRMLSDPPRCRDEDIVAFLAEVCAHSFPGRPNRAAQFGVLTPSDLDGLSALYASFFEYARAQRAVTGG